MGVIVNRAPSFARYHRDAYLLKPHDLLCWRRLYPPEHAVRYGLLSWLQTCGFSPTWAGRVWILSAPHFITPSKTLFALRAFVGFIDPARIVIGPKDNRRRRIGGRMFGALLWRRLNMGAGPSGAFNQRGGNNGGLGLFHLQPVTLYLVTTPARNPP